MSLNTLTRVRQIGVAPAPSIVPHDREHALAAVRRGWLVGMVIQEVPDVNRFDLAEWRLPEGFEQVFDVRFPHLGRIRRQLR